MATASPGEGQDKGAMPVLRQRDKSEEDAFPHQDVWCTVKGWEQQVAYTCP